MAGLRKMWYTGAKDFVTKFYGGPTRRYTFFR